MKTLKAPLVLSLAVFLLGVQAPGQDPQGRLANLEQTVLKLSASVDRLSLERGQQEQRIDELEAQLADVHGPDLEAQVSRIEESLRSSMPETRENALQIGGYFDIEFRDDKAGDKASEFDHHRLILKLNADIAQGIAFAGEIEWEGGGSGAGHLTDSEIVVEYAELSFEILEALNLRAGALLVPWGRFNLLHDSPLQDLTDRPLVMRRIIPTTWAEAGVGLYGAVHPASWLTLDYDFIMGNGLTDGMSSSGGMRGARGSYREDNNDDKMIIGRVGATIGLEFFDALNLGFSVGHGNYDDADKRSITMVGFDWTMKKGPWELVGEYAQARLSRGADEIAAGIPGGMEGWFAELRFHFFPESWRGISPLFNEQSTFTLVARYGTADTDTSGDAVDFAARGDRYRDDRRRLTLGFNFRPVERTVLKFEYQWIFEPGGVPDVDNNRFVASFATYF